MLSFVSFLVGFIFGVALRKERFFKKANTSEIIKWAFYGFLIPIWIQILIVAEYFLASYVYILSLVAGFIVATLRRFTLPLYAGITVCALLTLHFILIPNPENWEYHFTIGYATALGILGTALWLAPPFIASLAYARAKPTKSLAILSPFLFILLYAILFFFSLLFLGLLASNLSDSSNPFMLSYAVCISAYGVAIFIVYKIVRGVHESAKG